MKEKNILRCPPFQVTPNIASRFTAAKRHTVVIAYVPVAWPLNPPPPWPVLPNHKGGTVHQDVDLWTKAQQLLYPWCKDHGITQQ